jgi:hypothetical protein
MQRIDLIIDALQLARNEIHDPTLWTDKADEALAAARELRALKPVGWVTKDVEDVVDKFRLQHFKNGIPVYALDEVTK